MRKKQLNKQPISVGSGIVAGIIGCAAVTILGTCILTHLMSREILGEAQIGYGVVLILLIAAVIGSLTATMRTQSRRMLVVSATGGFYFLILLAITALFFDGQYEGVVVTLLVILAGSLAVGILGGNRSTSGKYSRRKTRNR